MSARRLLEAAIASDGSEAKLADAIGYSQNAVSLAKRRGWLTWEMATVLGHVEGIDPLTLCPEGDAITRRMNGHAHARKRLMVKRKRQTTRSKRHVKHRIGR